jgi:hypothetical protein
MKHFDSLANLDQKGPRAVGWLQSPEHCLLASGYHRSCTIISEIASWLSTAKSCEALIRWLRVEAPMISEIVGDGFGMTTNTAELVKP